ncbi:hypothetical protein E1A91_A05G361000v1 [Gossypium mustelinum]|uniref:Tubby C-terminal domain-containing protein n=4 Tax=Gossypium TaxID=3633 RepID=A0A2P5YLR4_GOSBA|nr:hypothetical protein ES319_A05G349900v1 [Gossypium barbadense]PPS16534.1 hypothetical protein GOBAR_AA04043 [Gossypium barbadense]TYH19662.1 hypothetical protein ES288_A05G369500v1 [Gossypium darwinii]TYI30265.1 hypothetical protein ES332_A05G374000v1 [Gossypium tomentosum]TYJ37205.1 hypothetical protein E1A91_A05G361000v1 [Gossypium mustelinum]
MAVPQMVYGVPMISFAGDGFCLPYPLDLIVNRKQHGLSNIHYQVSDGKGNLYLLADGSYTTLFRKRVLRNSAGFPILTIREKAITGKKWMVHRGESSEKSQLLFTVHRSRFQPKKTRLEVFLEGNIDKDISNFTVVGSNYPSQYIRVYKGDTILAEGKKESFRVSVHSGVDYAFIAALIIILVECE